ncbi:hypothetical protein AB0912_15345 [Streptomyces sp. NPDC007084]|uniref:hypothetical protein n=1 Tax=Streptomyces sp. NPDC007084 TaxID=3154313 RepID=UPI003452A618
MRGTVLDSYLGWRDLAHARDCRKPSWEAQVQVDDSRELTTVRLVCRACGGAHVLAGQLTQEWSTRIQTIGYGLPPRRVAGVLLWPGQPFWSFGRQAPGHPHPHDLLVTRLGVERVTDDAVVGAIYLMRGKLGGTVWAASALPDPDGTFAPGNLRWRYTRERLRSVGAAAKWIGERLAETEGGDR